MIAVAQVTMNRVKHPRYPNTVCEVVKKDPTYTCNQKPFSCQKQMSIQLTL